MNRIFTIIIGALALGAIVFLAIYEPLTRSSRERDNAVREGIVMPMDPSKVKEIKITSGDNELEIKRKGSGWQLGTKSKDRADTALIDQLLIASAQMPFFDRIEGKEFKDDDDWGRYGLKKPKRKIEFEGDGKVTLYLGKDAANEDRMYVRTSKSRDVYLVDDQILDYAFRDPGAFRDRRLTNLTPDQVDRLIVRRSGGEIELLHDATGWRLVKPLHARADATKMNEYLTRLLGLRVLDFVAEDTGDLSAYGLAEGRNEITFFAEGSDRHQTLRLSSGKEGELFGQFTARDSVYKLPVVATELLEVAPESLRDRRLLPLNLDTVDKIRISTPEKKIEITRSQEGWELRDGETPRPASEAAVRTLADAMMTAQVSRYVPMVNEKLSSFGLDKPAITVEFLSVLSENTPESRAGEQTIASVAIGKTEDGSAYVRIGEAPEVAAVPESIQHAIPTDPQAWAAPK